MEGKKNAGPGCQPSTARGEMSEEQQAAAEKIALLVNQYPVSQAIKAIGISIDALQILKESGVSESRWPDTLRLAQAIDIHERG